MPNPESANFIGNASEDASVFSLQGLSRVVEVAYVSPSTGVFLGNLPAPAPMACALGTSSRIPEVAYVSNSGS